MIALPYAEQLENKHASVRAAMQLYPELAQLDLAATEGAKRMLGYRTRAKLVVAGSAVGLFARGTHDVVDTPACQVLDSRVAELVRVLRRTLSSEVALDGIDVTQVAERLLVTLIAQPATDEHALRQLADLLAEQVPAVAGVAFTRRDPGAVQLLSGGHVLLRGVAELTSKTGAGPYHYVALGAFQQAHAETSAAIYERVAERLFASVRGSARPRVLELYAGSGALSLALAQGGAEVVAVESYGPACERLTRAAREQRLPVQVREGDAARELRALWQKNQRFDAVLVNPPRRGLDPEVREIVAQLSPKGLGYVSCKPSTLARDLAHFARLGLRCVEAVPFDMMPLTDQVETLAWLQPGDLSPPEVLYEQEALLVVDKGPHEPLDARGVAARVRSLPAARAALPVTTLATGSSGIVVFARAADQRGVVENLLSPERGFTALVRGVVRERGKLRAGGGGCRYVRLQVTAGHSLVRVQAADDSASAARIPRHRPSSDRRRAADRASAKHF